MGTYALLRSAVKIDVCFSKVVFLRSLKWKFLAVLIAAGPYFTSDTVSQDPINELLNQVKEHKPNLTILIGPFLDEKHFAAESGEIGRFFKVFQVSKFVKF